MEVNEDLALEVSPESVSARRASMHTSRSGLLGGSHSGSEVSLLTQQLQQGVRLGAEEYAALLRSKWFKHQDGKVPGYHGVWDFYSPGSADTTEPTKKFKCIRTYEATPASDTSTVPEISICNVHDGSASFGQPEQRPQDGLQQNSFRRLLSDPYFSCSMMQLDPLEAAEGLPAACFRRSVPITGESLDTAARVPPALPPGPKQPGDGPHRWSMGPLYSMDSLDFLNHFFVRERSVDVDLSGPIDLAALPCDEPRPRLDADPQRWLQGRWEGRLVDVVWDEDGEMVRLPPRLAVWQPPDAHRYTHRLFLLPDAMYGVYCVPKLPAVQSDAVSSFQNGIRFEVGGMMRTQPIFRRIILRYSITGQIEGISEETWRREQR